MINAFASTPSPGTAEAKALAHWWALRGVIMCENCSADLKRYHKLYLNDQNLPVMAKATKTQARQTFEAKAYVLIEGKNPTFRGDTLTNDTPQALHARLTDKMPLKWVVKHYAKHPALPEMFHVEHTPGPEPIEPEPVEVFHVEQSEDHTEQKLEKVEEQGWPAHLTFPDDLDKITPETPNP
jgi:hypothetical protein